MVSVTDDKDEADDDKAPPESAVVELVQSATILLLVLPFPNGESEVVVLDLVIKSTEKILFMLYGILVE